MKRAENEEFETYRERRAKANKALKAYLKGRIIWDSKTYGTYSRGMGPIGSNARR